MHLGRPGAAAVGRCPRSVDLRLKSRDRAGHMAAFLGTLVARIGAALAMGVRVAATFGTARLADLGTDATDLGGELRGPAHEGAGGPTDRCTVMIEPNAIDHAQDVRLMQARGGAIFAFLSAIDTCIHACLKLLLCHDRFSSKKMIRDSEGDKP